MILKLETLKNIVLKLFSPGSVLQVREILEYELIQANLNAPFGANIIKTYSLPISNLHIELINSFRQSGFICTVDTFPDSGIYTLTIGYPGVSNSITSQPSTEQNFITNANAWFKKMWVYKAPGGEPCYSSPIGPVAVRIPGPITKQAVIVNFFDWYCRALEVNTGAVLYEKFHSSPRYGRAQSADVDGDGLPEIFTPTHEGVIYAYRDDFVNYWQFPSLYTREGSGTITSSTSTSITDSTKSWATNAFCRDNATPSLWLNNARLEIPSLGLTGVNAKYIRTCPGGNTLTIEPPFTVLPTAGATYQIFP
ncbi:MAG: hypothetical protein ACRDBG_06405, partial [Waterburya sp.]